MKMLNTGQFPNDETGDKLNVAAEKINHNFSLVSELFQLKEKLRVIVWDDLSDSRKACEDINYNFEIIQRHLEILK